MLKVYKKESNIKQQNGNSTIVYTLIWLYVFSNCFTGISSLISLENIGTNIHIHMLVAVILIGYVMLVKRKVYYPNGGIFILIMFAHMTLVVLINLYRYNFSAFYITYAYDIVMMTIVFSMVDECINPRKIMQSVALVMAALILIKDMSEINAFLRFFRSLYGHPSITSFFGGGVNLEATWMTLFGCFFEKKHRYYFLLFTLIMSVMYASRTAIILNVFLLFIYLLQDGYKKAIKVLCVLIGVLSVCIIGGVAVNNELILYVLGRFANIGNEVGSNERIIMWQQAPQMIRENPFGMGTGNAIRYMNDVYGANRGENNIHNIYMQYLLDNGFVGLILYVAVWGRLCIEQIKNRFSSPYAVFCLGYAVGGMVQFTGKDTFVFIMLALYFAERRKAVKERVVYNGR